MKKILFSIAILISVNSFAQDSSYNAAIKFDITDSVDNTLSFKRKAFFVAMIYNQDIKRIDLQFQIDFYNSDGSKKLKVAKSYNKQLSITNDTYVLTGTGALIGSITNVLTLYGKPDGSGGYLKFGDGRYDLTTPVMGEYDYLAKGFDNNQKLHATIKAIGIREAAAGKLQ